MKKLLTKLKNFFWKKKIKSEIISENPKIIKFTIPVGNISAKNAEKELSKLIFNYKEDIPLQKLLDKTCMKENINFGATYSNYYTNDIWFTEKKN